MSSSDEFLCPGNSTNISWLDHNLHLFGTEPRVANKYQVHKFLATWWQSKNNYFNCKLSYSTFETRPVIIPTAKRRRFPRKGPTSKMLIHSPSTAGASVIVTYEVLLFLTSKSSNSDVLPLEEKRYSVAVFLMSKAATLKDLLRWFPL